MDIVARKVCCRCKQELPASDFSRHSKRKDGLQTQCKRCARGSFVKWREKTGNAAWAAYQQGWRERNPGKALAAVHRHYQRNREDIIAKVVAFRKANRDRIRARDRAWAQLNRKNTEYSRKRAALRKGATTVPFTREQLAAKMAYWGDRCWVCAGPMEAVDHYKPLTKGGPHVLANLRPICGVCNSRKRNKWPYPRPECRAD